MKLLRVKVRNLNSLYGDHEVDLEGRLGGAPLFLIQGPTGAGKSTLMDAIALALFGQTPRLPVAKTKTDVDSDCRNIMSRGTGEAHAEVELAKIEGGRSVRYRAAWSCRRSHGRAEGGFQDPRRLLERCESGGEWTTLADDSREKFYGPEFDKMLEGMSVEDFKRSVLLAQGEFAAFLRASEDERASILERLTDTGFYKELGARAAERRRAAEADREKAKAALGGIVLLGEAEEDALREERQALEREDGALRRKIADVVFLLKWTEESERLSAAADVAAAQLAAAQTDAAAAAQVLEALTEHERCAPAQPSLVEHERARAAAAALADQLPQRQAHEAACHKSVAELQQHVQAAETRAQEASRALEEAGPQLTEARRLRAALAMARDELSRSTHTRDLRSVSLEQDKKALLRAQKVLQEAQTERAGAEKVLHAAAWARPIAEALTGLQAQQQAIQAGRAALTQKAKRQAHSQSTLAQAREDLQALGTRQQELEARAGELHGQSQRARATVETLLDGASSVAARRAILQSAIQAHVERAHALAEVDRLLRDRLALEQKVQAEEAARVRCAEAHAEVATTLEALQRTLEGETQTLVAVRADLQDQQWMLGLAHERQRLQQDRACPLCGGTEHPWIHQGKLAEVDARVKARCESLATEQTRLEGVVAELQRRIREADRAESGARVRLSSIDTDLQAQRAAIEQVRQTLAAAAREAGLEDPSVDDLAAARDRLDEAAAQVRAAALALDDADAQLQTVVQAVSSVQTELDRVRVTRAERARAVDEAAAAIDALEEELKEEARRLEDLEQTLQSALLGCGIPCVDGIDQAIRAASEGVAKWRAADEALRSATDRVTAALGEAQQAQVRVEAATRAWQEADSEVQARTSAVGSLVPQVEAVLGGADPEVVASTLAGAAKVATEAVKAHAAKLKLAEADLVQARSERASHEGALAEARKLEAETQVELRSALRKLGLDDERSLLGRLLPPARVAELVQTRVRVDKALERAGAVLQTARAAVANHEAVRPAAGGETIWEPSEVIRVRLASLEKTREDAIQKHAVVMQKLDVQKNARDAWRERQKALDEADEAFRVWERLHGLIGVRDGDAFKRFAQTLNLAELMDRANHHLEQLAPRYTLIGATHANGEPRLAFAIRDSFQADQVRPISTLSGGETFLVSLALALALAGYRTVKMPIETLLLDEGFGTLDPQTLQVAMNALEALHAGGTQVGIITHVEALKERIPARVLVERCGNGRSTVRVESA